jgi:hypothetical protein
LAATLKPDVFLQPGYPHVAGLTALLFWYCKTI